MRRKAGRINEEHVCIDSFIQRLKEIDSGQKIFYCDNSEAKLDPPDFWVKISGTIFAVEVTSITDYDYEALCTKFFDDIRSEFATSNIIKGTYSLSVIKHPRIPKKGTFGWKTLISTIATRLQDMANAPSGIKYNILEDRNGEVIIRKSSDQDAKIRLAWDVRCWWGRGVIQEELSQLIRKAIEKKRKQLEKKRNHLENKSVLDQYKNVILLFYDAYDYSDVENIRKAFLNVQDYNWLHSIFVALAYSDASNKLYPDSPGRKGVFLYSKNELWQ